MVNKDGLRSRDEGKGEQKRGTGWYGVNSKGETRLGGNEVGKLRYINKR